MAAQDVPNVGTENYLWIGDAIAIRRDMLGLREREQYDDEEQAVWALDAGDCCHVCGNQVTWVDHKPPVAPGQPVRCFWNVRGIRPYGDDAA